MARLNRFIRSITFFFIFRTTWAIESSMETSFAVKEAIMIRHFVLSMSIYEWIVIIWEERKKRMDIFCPRTLYAENANAKRQWWPDPWRQQMTFCNYVSTMVNFFNPISPKHRSYICVCLTDGAERIFIAIPLFHLSHSKSSISRVIPSHWERDK